MKNASNVRDYPGVYGHARDILTSNREEDDLGLLCPKRTKRQGYYYRGLHATDVWFTMLTPYHRLAKVHLVQVEYCFAKSRLNIVDSIEHVFSIN